MQAEARVAGLRLGKVSELWKNIDTLTDKVEAKDLEL